MAAESGRYHLCVPFACPRAHRTPIFRAIKGLEAHIGLSVVHADRLTDGRTFATDFPGTTGDMPDSPPFLRDLYTRAAPQMSGRVTLPVPWDTHSGNIVSNERAKIIRMFNRAFEDITGNRDDYWPEPLRAGIGDVNVLVSDGVSNGVCRAGFAYWRLFRTLVRFTSIYHLQSKCNRRRIVDYPNLWA